MTIKELIAKLSEYPEDTKVLTRYHSTFACTPDIDPITVDANDPDMWEYGHDYADGIKAVLIGTD